MWKAELCTPHPAVEKLYPFPDCFTALSPARLLTVTKWLVRKMYCTVCVGKREGRGEHALLEQQSQNNVSHSLPSHTPCSTEGTLQNAELEPGPAVRGSKQDNKYYRWLWSSFPSRKCSVSVTDSEQTGAFVMWQTKEIPRASWVCGTHLRLTLGGFLITCSSSRLQEGP